MPSDRAATIETPVGASLLDRVVDALRDPLQRKGVNQSEEQLQGLVKAMLNCGKPIVAAVDGVAVGAGAILAMASDLRLATPEAKTAFLFTRVGLAGCDMGACAILPRIIGQGRAAELLYTGRTMSAEDLKEHHVILFGSVWANEWSGKLPLVEDFHVTGQATIENHHPRQGEAGEYRSKFDESTGKLVEDYALVTVKSNISSQNIVMVVAGLRSAGTEAAAEYVTNRTYLNDLNQRLREAGNPKYYQVLLKVGVESGIPTTISLVALHELQKTEQ